MEKINVAIVGVGNCASSLVQGVFYYTKNKSGKGLMNKTIGRYSVGDVNFVAAFDIDKRKIGKDLSQAIFAKPNCTVQFQNKIPKLGVTVQKGPVLDGYSNHQHEYDINRSFLVDDKTPAVDVFKVLVEKKVQVLVNFLPVGSKLATEHYAKACLKAKVAFVNCIPVFIASDKKWARRFEQAHTPIIGDDVASQFGATIIHKSIAHLLTERGIEPISTYQLNVGGNTDFLNMLNRKRLSSKKISKTRAIQKMLNEPLMEENIHIGPSDYIPFLNDNKICYINVKAKNFGGNPVELEMKLSVIDSPNSAGCVVDAIRCAKLALDNNIGGPLNGPSSFLMKSPPHHLPSTEAKLQIKKFIEEMQNEK